MVGGGEIGSYTVNGRQAHLTNKANVQMKKDDNKKSRAEEIIRMIRNRPEWIEDEKMAKKLFEDFLNDVRNNSKNFDDSDYRDRYVFLHKSSLQNSRDTEEEPFHEFKELLPAVNAMGLYNEIMSEINFENDIVRLKEIIAERLSQILEAIPDRMASSISCTIKGIDY